MTDPTTAPDLRALAVDTGTQYAGLTDMERVAATADFHMRTCDAPTIADCEECGRRLDRIQTYLAAVLPAHREQIAEELRAVARNQSGWLWFEVGEGALERVANHLAATGPSALRVTPQTPEQAEVVVPEAPEAQRTAEGVREAKRRLFGVLIASAHLLDVPFSNAPNLSPWSRSVKPAMTRLDAALRDVLADLGRVTRERDAAAENLEIMYRVRDETAVDLAKVTADRDRLAETIQQVRELHRPGDFPDCRACGEPWPCPTADALGDAGQADDARPRPKLLDTTGGWQRDPHATGLIREDPDAATGELRWHYGPTDTDPDPGKRWHHDCGGEIYGFKEGDICAKCGAQDEPADDAQRRDDEGETA